MSDNNRAACAAATKPLINSVESLTAYALSPEFAAVPAKISDEVRNLFRTLQNTNMSIVADCQFTHKVGWSVDGL